MAKGELMVGGVLLHDDGRAQPSIAVPVEQEQPVPEPAAPDANDEEGAQYNPQLIAEEYLDAYFTQTPKSHLIDPQRLFSNQETLDQEGFLQYYADESEVNVRIYLFDAKQEIPGEFNLESVVQKHYAKEPLTAVVYYFLGNPGRNQLMFGGHDSDQVEADFLRKMLDSAKVKAMERSEPSAQMESFIVQLSIRIFWIEQALIEARNSQLAESLGVVELSGNGSSEDNVKSKPSVYVSLQPYLLSGTVAAISVLMVATALVALWLIWKRSRRYTFPVLGVPRRLGAEHAAGVGAVMSFHCKTESPSSQRNRLPGRVSGR